MHAWPLCTHAGEPISWGFCNTSIAIQDKHITAKLMAYYDFAKTDVRVAGFCPWHWWEAFGIEYAGHEPQYGLGSHSYPGLREALGIVGRSIIGGEHRHSIDGA